MILSTTPLPTLLPFHEEQDGYQSQSKQVLRHVPTLPSSKPLSSSQNSQQYSIPQYIQQGNIQPGMMPVLYYHQPHQHHMVHTVASLAKTKKKPSGVKGQGRHKAQSVNGPLTNAFVTQMPQLTQQQLQQQYHPQTGIDTNMYHYPNTIHYQSMQHQSSSHAPLQRHDMSTSHVIQNQPHHVTVNDNMRKQQDVLWSGVTTDIPVGLTMAQQTQMRDTLLSRQRDELAIRSHHLEQLLREAEETVMKQTKEIHVLRHAVAEMKAVQTTLPTRPPQIDAHTKPTEDMKNNTKKEQLTESELEHEKKLLHNTIDKETQHIVSELLVATANLRSELSQTRDQHRKEIHALHKHYKKCTHCGYIRDDIIDKSMSSSLLDHSNTQTRSKTNIARVSSVSPSPTMAMWVKPTPSPTPLHHQQLSRSQSVLSPSVQQRQGSTGQSPMRLVSEPEEIVEVDMPPIVMNRLKESESIRSIRGSMKNLSTPVIVSQSQGDLTPGSHSAVLQQHGSKPATPIGGNSPVSPSRRGMESPLSKLTSTMQPHIHTRQSSTSDNDDDSLDIEINRLLEPSFLSDKEFHRNDHDDQVSGIQNERVSSPSRSSQRQSQSKENSENRLKTTGNNNNLMEKGASQRTNSNDDSHHQKEGVSSQARFRSNAPSPLALSRVYRSNSKEILHHEPIENSFSHVEKDEQNHVDERVGNKLVGSMNRNSSSNSSTHKSHTQQGKSVSPTRSATSPLVKQIYEKNGNDVKKSLNYLLQSSTSFSSTLSLKSGIPLPDPQDVIPRASRISPQPSSPNRSHFQTEKQKPGESIEHQQIPNSLSTAAKQKQNMNGISAQSVFNLRNSNQSSSPITTGGFHPLSKSQSNFHNYMSVRASSPVLTTVPELSGQSADSQNGNLYTMPSHSSSSSPPRRPNPLLDPPTSSPDKTMIAKERDALEEELLLRYTQLRQVESHYIQELDKKNREIEQLKLNALTGKEIQI